jgi:phenylpropionate dioxygenase-like ring-hydroxylating dioxygenase large terminal subunit
MAKNPLSAHESVPHRVTNPELIPAERYYEPEFFELEREKLWPQVWQMACRLEEIPEIGDFTVYTILDKSVILVNTKTGVKAFHNACRHRGVELAQGPGNCSKTGFICPFHGWRWNPEGKNTFVFGKNIFSLELLDHAEIDLAPCRVEFFAGCAFINFDDTAASLLDTLGPVATNLNARNADKLKMDWWYATVLPTNWKLAMEAFMEGYHTMRTHPQLQALTPPVPSGLGEDNGDGMVPVRNMNGRQVVEQSIEFMSRLSSGMSGMVHKTEVEVIEKLHDMPVSDDPIEALMAFYSKAREEITKDGLERGAPMFDLPSVTEKFPIHDVEFLFPHFFLLPMFAAMSSYRIRPLTVETCLFEIWSLVLRPEGEEFDTPKQPKFLPHDSPEFPEVPQQDYDNLPKQQRGLHAEKFPGMRLSHSWEGLISNYQRLIDGYIGGVDRESLIKANHIINNGYNAPIKDIGF